MDTLSLAQMRIRLNERKNPDFMSGIGLDQALDMSPMMYMNPNPKGKGLPAVGGVSDSSGLPVGGIDQDSAMTGQQLTPPEQQGQPEQPDQGQPQGQPQQGQPPQPPAPQGNMLSMTPQGQTLAAMKPQGMKKGGTIDPKNMAAMRVKIMVMKRDKNFAKGGEVEDQRWVPTSNPKRILFPATGHSGTKGIVVPHHMWEGPQGMKQVNKARAKIYGSEKRPPLNIGQAGRLHKGILDEHFAKPIEQQLEDERAALSKLRKAQHIGQNSNTLDKSEKLDTVRHERDSEGRAYEGFASKGVAGHSLYTSGHGDEAEHHVINTCPGQTAGCGGGKDENGIWDTSKGLCFAPNAESQYKNAAIRRASHEQAKHDPAMTKDWILAHTHSLRKASETADKKNLVTLFRPNVVDETDVSSRHVINGLNKQRKEEGKPAIIANSYGKTNELHDPENNYFVTHSNVGPKTKHGASIKENMQRDRQRIMSTINAADAGGKYFRNEQGNATPPKNSYMVTDVKRNSPLSKEMEKNIKYAKYWGEGRPINKLNEMEKDEGDEGHYNAKGQRTTPDQSHFGHMTFEGKRYDYQKQHILHPRLVQVGNNADGTPHMIPTDSRFKDNDFLPKNRYMTKNGKEAGAIIMTTPTESTSNVLHHSSFTHHVNPDHIARAQKNNGEYEVDSPIQQALADGREYVAPQVIKVTRPQKKSEGGGVDLPKEYNDDFSSFPERSFVAQHHHANRIGVEDEHDFHPHLLRNAEDR